MTLPHAATRAIYLLTAVLLLSQGASAQSSLVSPVVSQANSGPKIIRSQPYSGENIDVDSAFALTLDKAVVINDELLKHIQFFVNGIAESISASFLEQKEIALLLKEKEDLSKAATEKRLVFVRAAKKFPNDVAVKLSWGKGIVAADGSVTHEEQLLEFTTESPFTMSFNCVRENMREGCVSILPVTVSFSTNVSNELARSVYLEGPLGQKVMPKVPEQGAVSSIAFEPPFLSHSKYKVVVPANFTDERGRTLVNVSKLPLEVEIADVPSLAKFNGNFGVVENTNPALLPVTIRNVEGTLDVRMLSLSPKSLFDSPIEALRWLKRDEREAGEKPFLEVGKHSKNTQHLKIKKPNGDKALEVVGIPLPNTGLHIVEVESQVLGTRLLESQKPMFVHTMALRTDLAVHLKQSQGEALVWVTRLSHGSPVADAQVKLVDCFGNVLSEEKTNKDGLARFSKVKTLNCNTRQSLGFAGYAAFAKKVDDTAFTLPSWSRGIEVWNFAFNAHEWETSERLMTVLDRTLLRAGETLHMKHFARYLGKNGITELSRKSLPKTVEIRSVFDDTKYTVPLRWNEWGEASSEWKIPQLIRNGSYEVCLPLGKFEAECRGQFKISEFRVPQLRAKVKGPTGFVVGTREFSLSVGLEYLSGGNPGSQTIALRSQVSRNYLRNENFPGFSFAYGELDTKKTNRADSTSPAVTKFKLSSNGTGDIKLSGGDSVDYAQTMQVDVEYLDTNGETRTATTHADFVPTDVLVGVKASSDKAKRASVSVVVVDKDFKPIAGKYVEVEGVRSLSYGVRKRLVGGFYSYDYVDKKLPFGKVCNGKTDDKGLLFCSSDVAKGGSVYFVAHTKDRAGRRASSYDNTWVSSRSSWFPPSDNDRMDVLPDKKLYSIGDKAVLQVKTPFEASNALVTIERDGVLDAWVQPLSRESSLIEIPIKKEFLPNIYVSVFAVRGRIASPPADSVVDLGKPAFKLGYAAFNVAPREDILKVTVATDKNTYQVRDNVVVKVKVTNSAGRPVRAHLGFVAVDEGLLQLSPNSTWNLVDRFFESFPLRVYTATDQMHVVGKRHFGLKAVPTGGGGGKSPTRELFDTLLSWKPELNTDDKGEVSFSFKLQDSISAYRLVAFATEGFDKVGNGESNIRTTQDVMLMSSLAPVSRVGDRFLARFVLRNTTDRAQKLKVELTVSPKINKVTGPQSVAMGAHEERRIEWPIEVPSGVSKLTYDVIVKESGKTLDRLRIRQDVLPVEQRQIVQAVLGRIEKQGTEIKLPKIESGSGEFRVQPMASLGTGLMGVRQYMKEYPYSCLEQRVSRAVALADKDMWKRMVLELPKYSDSSGYLTFYPGMTRGDANLTAYVLMMARLSGFELPKKTRENIAETLLRSLRNASDDSAPKRLSSKLFIIDALSREGKFAPDMLSLVNLPLEQMSTQHLVHLYSILLRETALNDRDSRVVQVERKLREHLVGSGSFVTLTHDTYGREPSYDPFEANELNEPLLLLTLVEQKRWADEMPKLIYGRFAGPRSSHWGTTISNAIGSIALQRFSAVYEKEAVTGTSAVTLNEKMEKVTWKNGNPSQAVTLGIESGKATNASLVHKGSGSPWYVALTSWWHRLEKPLQSGVELKRSVVALEQRSNGSWSAGDLAFVKIDIRPTVARPWFVVEDPIPAGASIVTGGLAQTLAGDNWQGVTPATFEEQSLRYFRATWEAIDESPLSIGYVVRFNQGGHFELPATHAEAMYTPEYFADLPIPSIDVAP